MAHKTYIKGNLMLFNFYLKNISTIRSLPKWMRNPDTLQTIIEEKVKSTGKCFELSLPSEIGKKYNNDFEKMKSEMRTLHGSEKEKFSYTNSGLRNTGNLSRLMSIMLTAESTAWMANSS